MYGYTQPLKNHQASGRLSYQHLANPVIASFLEVFICTLKSNGFTYVFYPHGIAVIFAEKQFEKKIGHRQISTPCLTFCFNSS